MNNKNVMTAQERVLTSLYLEQLRVIKENGNRKHDSNERGKKHEQIRGVRS